MDKYNHPAPRSIRQINQQSYARSFESKNSTAMNSSSSSSTTARGTNTSRSMGRASDTHPRPMNANFRRNEHNYQVFETGGRPKNGLAAYPNDSITPILMSQRRAPLKKRVLSPLMFQNMSKENQQYYPQLAENVSKKSLKKNRDKSQGESSTGSYFTGKASKSNRKPFILLQENSHESHAPPKKKREMSPIPLSENISLLPFGTRQSASTSKGQQFSAAPPPPLLRQTSSAFSTAMPPMLRETSSSFSIYNHHDMIPPQLRLTTSRGQQLISDPLLQTPHLPTPASRQILEPSIEPSSNQNVTSSQAFYPELGFSNSVPKPTNVTSIPLAAMGNVPFSGSNFQNLIPPFGFNHNLFPAHPALFNQNFAKTGASVPGTNFEAKKETQRDYVRRKEITARYLFDNVPRTNRPCTCPNSRCLKLYCECFHNGLLCDERLCSCDDCHNNEAHCIPRGEREIAIKKILARRPEAFTTRVKKRTGKRCGCKKSGCLKKYCECVANGKLCSDDCTCTECKNKVQINNGAF